MDWSLIALLFAVGFALTGLALLISTVSKAMTKPPPSQNLPPTAPQPPPCQQSPVPSAYNWSLNGARVQKLALGQGSGGAGLPTYTGEQLFMGQPEETEPGLIPMSYSVIPAQIPVFTPELVHRAQRVYETPEPAPIPHSVAMPVGEAPEPNAVATPASYFREPPVVQDVSGRKIKEVVNRANRPSSVATPINPDGEARGFFREEEVIEMIGVEVYDDTSGQSSEEDNAPAMIFEQKSPESAPPIQEFTPILDPVPAPVPEPNSGSIPAPEPNSVSKPIPDNDTEKAPDETEPSDPSDEEDKSTLKPVKRKRARGKNRRKPQGEGKKKKAPPEPNAPPAEKVDPTKEDEKNPGEKPKSEEKLETEEKPGLKGRIMKMLRAFIGRIAEKIPEPIRSIAGPVLICVCVAVCLLCLSLFTYFDKHPYVPEETPVVVDIPLEDPDPEPEPETEENLGAVAAEEPRYKMAMIGEQEVVSSTAEGFEPNFEVSDYTNVPFYALTFAIQLDSDPGSEFQKIQVLDADTMEDLTSTGSSILHVYTGEIPSDEYLIAHPVKSAPVISSAVSDEIITCVFVSLEKRSIYDLKVILYQATSGADTLTEKEVMVNGRPEDLRMTAVYPMGNSLMRLGDQYYVAESGTGIGAVPDENKYVTRKIRCVSLPLTGAVSGLDASSIALFDRQTGERREMPAGTEMYYQENYVEGMDVMEVSFGIQLSGGSYEEAAAFLDSSFPGYVLDGQSIMF